MSISDYLVASEQALTAARTYAGTARIDEGVNALVSAARAGAPILVCGNGGSASDAMHITGELVGRFLKERQAINCLCLSSNPAILTAWSNDYSYETVFSRQVEAHGSAGGAIIGLSTSGNSPNVIAAFRAARAIGMTTVGFTGEAGGKMAEVTDILVDVPSKSTPLIQQVHICLYHYLCQQVEAQLFPGQ